MMRNHSKGGYTLIELMVSVAVFAIVMLAATAAYLSFINYNRRASQVATLMNTLSFALDGMARDIRTGTDYACSGSCSDSGETEFTFIDADQCVVTYRYSGAILYKSRENTVPGCIARSNVPVVSPEVTPGVTLTDVKFYLRGTAAADQRQTLATIVIRGTTEIVETGQAIPFSIETSATSRVPDAGN